VNLYVLVATAVYDQGVIGVYATEELARDAVEEIWPLTDGHHGFRIDVCELDTTYDVGTGVLNYWGHEPHVMEAKRRGREPSVELNPKSAPDV
jgi:hypothetical protein